MGVRLLVLVVVAGGLSVYLSAKNLASPAAVRSPDTRYLGPGGDLIRPANMDGVCETVGAQPISGHEPEVEPDIEVQVEVDTSSGKNRLYFTISEAHGYYLDEFRLLAWWVSEGVSGPDDSPLTVPVYLNQFKKANETLRTCIELVPAELAKVGGDIGASANWDVMLVYYGRAREKNPEKFPVSVVDSQVGCNLDARFYGATSKSKNTA
jgi:hypothetical protein